MIHIVIPAAGTGSRFVAAGKGPKIFAEVDGVPMLRRVVDNIREVVSHVPDSHRVTVVTSMTPPFLGEDVEVVQLATATRGAVETILNAGIGEGPLLVANCDQLLGYCRVGDDPADGWIATFKSTSPHHSYVRTDDAGVVTAIAEKVVISDQAVAGLYLFEDGSQFADAAHTVLDEDRRVLGEFYVSTVLDEMIRRGLVLRTFPCRVDILGTPEELDAYHARVEAIRSYLAAGFLPESARRAAAR